MHGFFSHHNPKAIVHHMIFHSIFLEISFVSVSCQKIIHRLLGNIINPIPCITLLAYHIFFNTKNYIFLIVKNKINENIKDTLTLLQKKKKKKEVIVYIPYVTTTICYNTREYHEWQLPPPSNITHLHFFCVMKYNHHTFFFFLLNSFLVIRITHQPHILPHIIITF